MVMAESKIRNYKLFQENVSIDKFTVFGVFSLSYVSVLVKFCRFLPRASSTLIINSRNDFHKYIICAILKC